MVAKPPWKGDGGLLLRSVPAAWFSSAGPGGTASKTDIQQCKQQFLFGSE